MEPLLSAPSQPCTSSSAPSSEYWSHVACSPQLYIRRLQWPNLRPPVFVNARQLSSVSAVQFFACRSRRTPCCFRVCEERRWSDCHRSAQRAAFMSCRKYLCQPTRMTRKEVHGDRQMGIRAHSGVMCVIFKRRKCIQDC